MNHDIMMKHGKSITILSDILNQPRSQIKVIHTALTNSRKAEVTCESLESLDSVESNICRSDSGFRLGLPDFGLACWSGPMHKVLKVGIGHILQHGGWHFDHLGHMFKDHP